MNVDKLMRGLDRLDHHERLASLIEQGRALSSAEANAWIEALAGGDVQRRRLALHLAHLRRELAPAWAAVDDPSLSVRSFAAKLIGRYADTIASELLDRLDAASLATLLRELCRRGRASVAEGLVEGLLARERVAEAAVLLPVCRPAWIVEHLDRAAWPELVWLRLARYRPELVIDRITAMFAASPDRPDLVWRRFGYPVWARLARERPQAVMAWLDRHADAESLPNELILALPELAGVDPGWVVGTLGRRVAWVARVGLPKRLARQIREVDDDTLAPLCRGLARLAPAQLGSLLAQLPYPRRGSAFELATASLETARIEWPTSLLAILPTPLRDREAARMLTLARAQTDAAWRRELLGLREIGAVRELLEREGRAAQATDRAQAHEALIRSTARSRAGMPETLAWLGRLRNEQDPVRQVVLAALAGVPGHRFDDPAALDLVIAPLFDARDTSHLTRNYAAQIAHRLMTTHATTPSSAMFGYALSVLERLAGQSGTPALPRLDRNLPRGAELAIVAALLPWIEAAKQRQQDHHVFALWNALGKRAWQVPALAKLLADMIWHGHKANAAWTAQLWIADPATRDERVRELVKRDRSALYIHAVFVHCHRRRQTLLVDRLTDKPPRGRFHDGKVAIVPSVSGGFERWPTPLQQQYVDLIGKAEAAPKQFSQHRAALVALRARVPITRAEDLADALASSDVPVQEAALAGLVWLDDPRPALAILLEHLDGDRARVAMYAMPRLARLLPRDRFVDALAELLARPKLKVTVHKEIVRLLGQLATPRSLALLRGVWAQPLHRDVRIATLHAARSLLGHAEAWVLLGEAARDPDEDLARALVEVPMVTVAQAHRARYLAVMVEVADHASPIARASLFAGLLQGWASVDPVAVATLAARVITRLDPHDPWRLAARVMAEGGRSSVTHETIVSAIQTLIAASERDVAPAGERDRMAHQRLLGATESLMGDRHPTSFALLERLADALATNPHTWTIAAGLRLAATANPALARVCVELLDHSPTPRQRIAVEQAARAAALVDARDWSSEDALAQVETLEQRGAGLVAVAMLASFGPRWGWGAAWTKVLARLREHPSDVDVRLAARGLWIATS